MKRRKLLQKIVGGFKNIKFAEMVNLVEGFGVEISRTDGSHHIFFRADIPDLEACSAFGDTPYEALQEAQKAKELWIDAARSEGKPIPPPKYRPIIYQVVSA